MQLLQRPYSHGHGLVALTLYLLSLLTFQASVMFSVYLEHSKRKNLYHCEADRDQLHDVSSSPIQCLVR